MNKRISLVLIALCGIILFTSFGKADMRKRVLITTRLGNIKILLYDETPQHRDNFLKLVQNKTYDSTIFHRIIPQFMIQGGDPDSKRAKVGQPLGNGNVGYTLPAEIHPNLFHKRGALAAARLGDDVNPNKESSGCQFYLVMGKTFTDSTLDETIRQRIDQPIKQKIFNTIISRPENAQLKAGFVRAQQTRNRDSVLYYSAISEPLIQAEFEKTPHRVITPEQREVYKTVGGTPHLDGGYTVFGEVVEGLEIIDLIGALPRNKMDRPDEDVSMTMKVVKK
ncbi:MAG: peptidylprolyl isomerase [Bacteroidia bacterium]